MCFSVLDPGPVPGVLVLGQIQGLDKVWGLHQVAVLGQVQILDQVLDLDQVQDQVTDLHSELLV